MVLKLGHTRLKNRPFGQRRALGQHQTGRGFPARERRFRMASPKFCILPIPCSPSPYLGRCGTILPPGTYRIIARLYVPRDADGLLAVGCTLRPTNGWRKPGFQQGRLRRPTFVITKSL